MSQNKKLILISLNELNFELIDKYIEKYNLKSLKHILQNLSYTNSEKDYKLLEPWIQWFSAYTGLEAQEHGIFRLGDGASSNFKSIFKILSEKGIKVGAISPMNIKNDLSYSDYFIPDPWTITRSTNNFWHRLVHKCISELVKDNARKKIKILNYFLFLLVFIKFSSFKKYGMYFKLFFKSLKKKWFKSLFLDYFLHDLHLNLLFKNNTEFSNIFFNSIAHVQHHYFYNSEIFDKNQKNPNWYIPENEDPFKDSLELFDKILEDYLKIENKYSIFIATGLRQITYDTKKFYYRLKYHKKFFSKFGLNVLNVQELMSRDFVLTFNNNEECLNSYRIISKIHTNENKKIFGDFDVRQDKLFLTLTFSEEITNQFILNKNNKINLGDYVDFVAIKNGMHDGRGYIYSSDLKKPDLIEIHKIKEIISNYYEIQ